MPDPKDVANKFTKHIADEIRKHGGKLTEADARRLVGARDLSVFTAGRENGRGTVSGEVYTQQRPKGWVRDWRPQLKTRKLLAQVDEILDDYVAHLPLTVRQVFYRLVGRYEYEKTEKAATALYEQLVTARRARRLDWRAIRDDGVTHLSPFTRFANASSFFDWLGHEWVDNFELNPAAGQIVGIEVWTEASGMTRQLDRICDPYGVPIYSGSGFDSLTAKLETVERIVKRDQDSKRGRQTVILRIGDHDPSGRSIIDSFAEDVIAFLSEYDLDGDGYPHDLSDLLTVEHIAVTEDQIDEHNLPTAPQKPKDKRAGHMARTVQAEALPPDVLAEILEEKIREHLNIPMLEKVQAKSGLEAARVADRFYQQRGQGFWADQLEITAGRENGEE
jgi:hypothetical protein